MTINQVSVLIENEQGRLGHVVRLMADAGIDLRAMLVADTQNYGILRMIASDTEKTVKLLQENGYIANVTPVTAIDVPDEPGGLAAALDLLSAGDVNVEYMYAFIASTRRHAYVVLRVADNEKAAKLLTAGGVHIISEADISAM